MPSLVEIGPVVLEKRIFFYFVNVFLLFRYYLPLEKVGALQLNGAFHPRMLCAKFGLKWTSGFVEEDGNVNSFGQTERRTIGDQKSSLEPSAQVG